MPLTLKNFNNTTPPYKTFTISRTEQSNMSSGWTYSDDATGLTAGSTEFDKFFGYSGVRLSSAGVETAEITQENSGGYGKLDITQLGTLNSGNNVMIKFPVRGIKMSKSGSVVTLSITDGIGREAEGFQYYAFQNTGDVDANASTTVETKPLYLGTYLSYTNGSQLQSWSGRTPQGGYTIGNAISYAGNNGTGWTIAGWYQRCLINAYYMMKYGNPNSQSVVGMGYVGGNSKVNTGGTNSQTNATYGTSSSTVQCKLFGLEDWWGNQQQWVGGMFTASGRYMYVALHDFTGSTSTGQSQYKSVSVINPNTSNFCLSSILGTNKGMFGPTDTVSNGNYNTYYGDYACVNNSCVAASGGAYSDASLAGAFLFGAIRSTSNAYEFIGSRLMYL